MIRIPTASGKKLVYRAASLITTAAMFAGMMAIPGATPAFADNVAPTAPLNLRIDPSTTSTDGVVVVTWTAPAATDIAYYQVFRYNGTATPGANELTFLGQTESSSQRFFIDEAPGEGRFRYAVNAVDSSGNASVPTGWVGVTVDLPTNGAGTVTPDLTAPATPTGLSTGAAFSKVRSVTLRWAASPATDLWRYLIYQADGTQTPKMISYADATSTGMTAVVTADHTYTYYVIAQDKAGNASVASTTSRIVVDATAPIVQIATPVAGQTYRNDTSLNFAATITDSGAGYDATGVKYYLDGTLLASPTVNLANVTVGAHTAKVEATDRAGNVGSATATFVVGNGSANPTAPQNLTGPTLTKSRSVNLTWTAPSTGTVTQYVIHRITPAGARVVAGSTLPSVMQFTDTVTGDGIYQYRVVAENETTFSPDSNMISVKVDTTAPAISIQAPKEGHRYAKSGSLPVQVTISDATSGYDAAKVKLLLDAQAFTGTSIDLAALAKGNHTFRVEIADRAGNQSVKSVQFSVGTIAKNDDDEDDDGDNNNSDDNDDKGRSHGDLIKLLLELRGKINHDQFEALLAKARAGNFQTFIEHVKKHKGEFIAPDAAEKLMKAAGSSRKEHNKNSSNHHGRGHDD